MGSQCPSTAWAKKGLETSYGDTHSAQHGAPASNGFSLAITGMTSSPPLSPSLHFFKMFNWASQISGPLLPSLLPPSLTVFEKNRKPVCFCKEFIELRLVTKSLSAFSGRRHNWGAIKEMKRMTETQGLLSILPPPQKLRRPQAGGRKACFYLLLSGFWSGNSRWGWNDAGALEGLCPFLF